MKFSDALRAVRRNGYLHGKDWRVAIIAPSSQTLSVAYDEAVHLFEASSMLVTRKQWSTRTIELERGTVVRFHYVEDSMDPYKLSGSQYTHIIVLDARHGYPDNLRPTLDGIMRSPVLDNSELILFENVIL